MVTNLSARLLDSVLVVIACNSVFDINKKKNSLSLYQLFQRKEMERKNFKTNTDNFFY